MINNQYEAHLERALSECLSGTHYAFGERFQGKVRDCYLCDDRLVMITTDRLSAFDRVLCTVPFKGQVLNLLSAWWYEKTEHIVPNALLALPHPNVMIAKKCRVFPIEFVMRAYMTGSTSTSIWMEYQQGVRQFGDMTLGEGMQKNARLSHPILTPTTKSDEHDVPITLTEIVNQGLMTQAEVDAVSHKAHDLFAFGAQHAAEKGLILVDTKYEFGCDLEGNILLLDEVHTPDSSRYWLKDTYDARMEARVEPDSFDKEMLRLWLKKQVNPYDSASLPPIPASVIIQLAARYIELYERLTGLSFVFRTPKGALIDEIKQRVVGYL